METLLGDCTKAKTQLGWAPKTSFKDLVEMMIEHDLKLVGLDRKDDIETVTLGALASTSINSSFPGFRHQSSN